MTPEERYKEINKLIGKSFEIIATHSDRIRDLREESRQIRQTAARVRENYNQKMDERLKQATPAIIAQIESGLAEHISKLNLEDDCA